MPGDDDIDGRQYTRPRDPRPAAVRRRTRSVRTTNGNLSAHLGKLVAGGYIAERKRFVRRRPQTRYRLTEAGRAALVRHVESLQALIRPQA